MGLWPRLRRHGNPDAAKLGIDEGIGGSQAAFRGAERAVVLAFPFRDAGPLWSPTHPQRARMDGAPSIPILWTVEYLPYAHLKLSMRKNAHLMVAHNCTLLRIRGARRVGRFSACAGVAGCRGAALGRACFPTLPRYDCGRMGHPAPS
jgi:hypothetical protein